MVGLVEVIQEGWNHPGGDQPPPRKDKGHTPGLVMMKANELRKPNPGNVVGACPSLASHLHAKEPPVASLCPAPVPLRARAAQLTGDGE